MIRLNKFIQVDLTFVRLTGILKFMLSDRTAASDRTGVLGTIYGRLSCPNRLQTFTGLYCDGGRGVSQLQILKYITPWLCLTQLSDCIATRVNPNGVL